jgi:L-ribulokinase
MGKYALGIDFGTLSARALVAEIGTGRELASFSMDYPHGVMDDALPDGTRLPPDWALQHPGDYVDALKAVVPEALKRSGVPAEEIAGVGIDFTACTVLPVDASNTPLCLKPEWAKNPHAYVKLWKHHAAQKEADALNRIARERGEAFLARYGGKTSSEWIFPKIWQILNEAPEVYRAADRFLEAADWVVWLLTGEAVRSACAAGYKALWSKREGYPSPDFFRALDPRLERVVEEKLKGEIRPIGDRAGAITKQAAALTGLKEGTPVAVANIDAHVSMPPAGLTEPGDLIMILGTSTCHIMVGREEKHVPGICGVVEDGIIPGLMGYEANQVTGDHFNWFVDHCVPERYAREAREKGVSPHQLLGDKAARLKPGESGLIALDWWNGNRSVLVDGSLSGLILGLTLTTRPEEIYRALVEATAFGARTIHEAFENAGVPVKALYACGGIARKDPFFMQVYADVTGREIRVARSAQAPALGSAMFAAVAAGRQAGGYDSIVDAAREMGGLTDAVYRPDAASHEVYNRLYEEYRQLHDWFGSGGSDAMRRLKAIKEAQRT